MSRRVYCLECNAVVGEEFEGGEGARGDRLAVCQTCSQHRLPVPSLTGPPAFVFWRWLSGSRG